ncbi:MAG: type IV pilus secretin PilQ [Natronospirillum sp.]|uniref:type IV pilus secretin PilQ n=1 Tax=Natronospirillum sp. TaxID=2812955 RepID=UPI002600E37A|nr:type IV pilus secretin PilQ [Natronospirillum sp.]MCH8550407.1 type IV pilus secretin PilQ [Natronospirillum sp.]
MKTYRACTKSWRRGLVMLAGLFLAPLTWSVDLTDISYVGLDGGRAEITLQFDGPAPEPTSYEIQQPARISIDLPDTVSALPDRYYNIGLGNTRAATVLTSGERTRVVLNLNRLEPHDVVRRGDNELVITVGGARATADVAREGRASGEVRDLDFRRNEEGEAQVRIQMSDNRANVDISRSRGRILVDIPDYVLPDNLARRLDVLDFSTAVQYITARQVGTGTRIEIEPEENFDYAAFQTGNTLAINVKSLTPEEQLAAEDDFPFTGERISFNFQDVELRRVLQIIADTAGKSLVVADNVGGNITILLDNVPWDQALDIILTARNLDQRAQGDVLLIAPAQEIADQEQQRMANQQAMEELAPLETEFVQINYTTVSDVLSFIRDDENLLSSRGAATVDQRTNSLLLRDTAPNLIRIREAIDFIDRPVRQVMLESRIVVAQSSFTNDMGIRWGGGAVNRGGTTTSYITTGGIGGAGDFRQIGAQWSNYYDGGPLPDFNSVAVPTNTSVNPIPQPVNPGAAAFTVGFAALDYALDLELSALESRGQAEIVSQPKLITSDGNEAEIASGTTIPFPGPDGGTEFVDAVLSMTATPRITPDNRVMLNLEVVQDSPAGGGSGNINTNTLRTQVLVDDGETLVLGGVYRVEDVEEVNKIPVLGDLPVLGRFFRSTSQLELKNELLIFITPRLIEDRVAGN